MRSPRSIDISITSKCNLHCRYCYFFDRPGITYTDLPTAEWLRFFKELGKLKVMNVAIMGGEPFLRSDLDKILEGIVYNRMRFYILSNGSLINNDIAKFIKSTGRCNFVMVSLDGSCAEIHDASRGQGSFEGAVRGIKTLQRHDIPVTACVTINHYNVHDLDSIARFILDDLGLSLFESLSPYYLGSCLKHADEIQLTAKDRMKAMATLLKLSDKYPGRISAEDGPLYEVRSWKRMEESRLQTPASKEGGHLDACGNSSISIHVHSDGTITPCPFLPQINLGRINRDSLSEVWQNSPVLNNMRSRCIALADFEFCQGCDYINYCKGICPATISAYSKTGELDHPGPGNCLRVFLRDGGKLP